MTGSGTDTHARPARDWITEASTSGPELMSTSPEYQTAGRALSSTNAQVADSGE